MDESNALYMSDLYLQSDSFFHCQINSYSPHYNPRAVFFCLYIFFDKTICSIDNTKNTGQKCLKLKSRNNVRFIQQNGKLFSVSTLFKARLFLFKTTLLSIGMSFYQVIKLLKQNDDQIKSVILVYNDKVLDNNQPYYFMYTFFFLKGSIKCRLYIESVK